MAEDVEMSIGSCFTIYTENICSIYVMTSDSWTKEKRHLHRPFAITWIRHEFCEIIIMGDETRVYGYSVKMKQQSLQWNWSGGEADSHLHLVLRWGLSGAIPILPPYAFMTCPGTTLPRAVCY